MPAALRNPGWSALATFPLQEPQESQSHAVLGQGSPRTAQDLEKPPAWDSVGPGSPKPAPPLMSVSEVKRAAPAPMKETKEAKKVEQGPWGALRLGRGGALGSAEWAAPLGRTAVCTAGVLAQQLSVRTSPNSRATSHHLWQHWPCVCCGPRCADGLGLVWQPSHMSACLSVCNSGPQCPLLWDFYPREECLGAIMHVPLGCLLCGSHTCGGIPFLWPSFLEPGTQGAPWGSLVPRQSRCRAPWQILVPSPPLHSPCSSL